MHITCPVQVSDETTTETAEVCFTRLPFSPWKPKKTKKQEDVYLQFLSTSIIAVGRTAHFLSPPRDVYTYVSTIGGEECRFFVRSRMLFFLSLKFSFTHAHAPRPTCYTSAAVIIAAFAVPVTKPQARTVCRSIQRPGAH